MDGGRGRRLFFPQPVLLISINSRGLDPIGSPRSAEQNKTKNIYDSAGRVLYPSNAHRSRSDGDPGCNAARLEASGRTAAFGLHRELESQAADV